MNIASMTRSSAALTTWAKDWSSSLASEWRAARLACSQLPSQPSTTPPSVNAPVMSAVSITGRYRLALELSDRRARRAPALLPRQAERMPGRVGEHPPRFCIAREPHAA